MRERTLPVVKRRALWRVTHGIFNDVRLDLPGAFKCHQHPLAVALLLAARSQNRRICSWLGEEDGINLCTKPGPGKPQAFVRGLQAPCQQRRISTASPHACGKAAAVELGAPQSANSGQRALG